MRRRHGSIAAIITDRLRKNDADRRKSDGPHVWASKTRPQYDLGREVNDEQHSCDGQTTTIHSLRGDSMKSRIALLSSIGIATLSYAGGSKVVEVALLKIEWGVSGA